MKVTINNRIGRPAKEHLEKFKTRFPPFQFANERTYNGIVIEIDDEDYGDLTDALSCAGFNHDSDEAPAETGSPFKFPKMSLKAKATPKTAPRQPKFLR